MTDSTSLLGRLRAQREAALAPKRMELEVPGYGGLLAIRYKPIPWEDMTSLIASASTARTRSGVKNDAQALVKACDAFLVREEGRTQTLADALRAQGEDVHGEVGFDPYLIETLALTVKVDPDGEVTFDDSRAVEERPPQGAVETVFATFGGAVSPELAISEHAARLAAWMRGAGAEIAEELAGGF